MGDNEESPPPPPVDENNKTKPPEPEKKQDVFMHVQHVENLAKGNMDFSLKLYQGCRLETMMPNFVVAPFGVSVALAMLWGGAKGETADQIKDMLSFENVAEEYIHLAFEDLLASLNSTKLYGSLLRLAHRIYMQEDFNVQPEFLAVMKRHYEVTVPSVNFIADVDRIRMQINHWAETQTDKKVKDLIGSGGLDHLSRSVLISATYFRGVWLRKFYHDPSHPGRFHTDKEKTSRMDMIQQQGRYMYCYHKVLKCSAVEIPYAGHRLACLIILPKDITGLIALEPKLNGAEMETLLSKMKMTTVNITMPRFHVEAYYNMADSLARMGLSNAFSRKNADLTGFAVPPDGKIEKMYVASLYAKAAVDVEEEGGDMLMEVPIARSSCFCMTNTVVQFTADKPFIFVIRDVLSGMVLFIGRVREPLPPRKEKI